MQAEHNTAPDSLIPLPLLAAEREFLISLPDGFPGQPRMNMPSAAAPMMAVAIHPKMRIGRLAV